MNNILVCQPEVNLDIKTTYENRNGTQMVVLTFNQSIQDVSLEIISGLNISIIFQKTQTPIPYNYSIIATENQIFISFDFKGHLIPNNVLAITLASQVQTNSTTFILKNDKFSINLPEYYPYSDAQKQIIKTTASIASAGSTVNTIYSMGSSFVFKSLHSIRSELVDSMINYFIFMNITFPPNFVEFAKENIGEPGGLVPNLFTMILPVQNKQNISIIDPSINLYEYARSMTFLTKYGNKLTLFVILLGFIFCLEFTFKFFSKKLIQSHPVIKMLKYISYSFRWNFMISEVIADFQESTFSAMFGLESAQTTIDKFASCIGFVLTVASIVVLYFIAKKVFGFQKSKTFAKTLSIENASTINNEESTLDRYAILHKALKAHKFSNLLFFCFLLVRSFGFSLVLIFASKIPIIQLVYLFITTLAMISYLIIYLPIKEKNQLILTIGYEIMLLISICLATAIYIYSKTDINAIEIRSNLGFGLMFVSMGMIVMNVISLLIELYEFKDDVAKWIKRKRVSKIAPAGEVGSINNSTMIMSKLTPRRSGTIFSKASLKKSLSQQKLVRAKQLTLVKSDTGSETIETITDNKLTTEVPLNRTDSLDEVERELQRKGQLKLMIRKNYKLMNEAIMSIVNTKNTEEEQVTSIHDIEDQEKRFDTSVLVENKQNTIIEIGRNDLDVKNTITSSINDIPTIGSMIFDSLNPEKKLRSSKLIRSQIRLNSRIISSSNNGGGGVGKTLPDIDEV
ncbi:MAG: hypothetical protein EOO43_09175 [Flavobacterium sp.]|nr:MAG: hypothetical protein EOO43_09175 [Flavobacterium sp.]